MTLFTARIPSVPRTLLTSYETYGGHSLRDSQQHKRRRNDTPPKIATPLKCLCRHQRNYTTTRTTQSSVMPRMTPALTASQSRRNSRNCSTNERTTPDSLQSLATRLAAHSAITPRLSTMPAMFTNDTNAAATVQQRATLATLRDNTQRNRNA